MNSGKKKGLGRGLSALFGDTPNKEKSSHINEFEKKIKSSKPWIFND